MRHKPLQSRHNHLSGTKNWEEKFYIEIRLAAFFVLHYRELLIQIYETTNWVEQIPVSEFENAETE